MAVDKGYNTGFRSVLDTKASFDASKAAQLKLNVQTNLEGSQAVIKFFQNYKSKLTGKFPKALVMALRYLLTKIRDIVPVDTGRLYKSLKIDYSGAGMKTEAFIKTDVPYAVWVHEDLEKAHGRRFNEKYAQQIADGIEHPRRPQEQAKYVENPAREHSNQQVMAVLIRENLQ